MCPEINIFHYKWNRFRFLDLVYDNMKLMATWFEASYKLWDFKYKILVMVIKDNQSRNVKKKIKVNPLVWMGRGWSRAAKKKKNLIIRQSRRSGNPRDTAVFSTKSLGIFMPYKTVPDKFRNILTSFQNFCH